MTTNKIRVGVVGCGKISQNHIASITELNDQFELVGVCDNQAESLKRTCDSQGVEGYSTLDKMLQQDLDVVSLCSPSGLHAEQTIQSAAAGKHIITEKPMATRWSDGVNMVNACDKAGVKLFVVKQVRYQPAVQLLKEAIDKQRFGRIYMINLNVFWTRSQQYYDQASWRGTWALDGGAFMNQASHYVDLLYWLFGPVQDVHAMMSTLAMNIETEDTGVLNLRWRSGALGSMNVTMLTYPRNLQTSITVLGEKGSVKIGGLAANQILHWEFSQPEEQDKTALLFKEPPQLASHHGHKKYYENVARTLLGKENASTDGREGLRSLEILTASYLSARDNKPVSLAHVY
jgi:UDP-N-acetyl-2-amino-2-deoxyglucuronate dehydrogenase